MVLLRLAKMVCYLIIGSAAVAADFFLHPNTVVHVLLATIIGFTATRVLFGTFTGNQRISIDKDELLDKVMVSKLELANMTEEDQACVRAQVKMTLEMIENPSRFDEIREKWAEQSPAINNISEDQLSVMKERIQRPLPRTAFLHYKVLTAAITAMVLASFIWQPRPHHLIPSTHGVLGFVGLFIGGLAAELMSKTWPSRRQ
jgi:heme O synthase-like polyprenyltransferase